MTGSPYQLLPDLAQDDLLRLTESIRDNGVEMPVVVDEDGNILDGHHRQMIADSLGIECPRIVKGGLNEHQKRIYAAEMNLARRQLTGAQKVLLGEKIEPDIRAEAKARQGARNDISPVSPGGETGEVAGDRNILENFPECFEWTTRDDVATKLGIGTGKTYEAHKKILDALANEPDGDQLMERIESGEWDIKEARKQLKRRHPPVRASGPAAESDQVDQEPAPPSKPSPKLPPPPIYVIPTGMSSISAASAMLELTDLMTANIAESGDYLFDMAQDIDAYLDSLPKIISTMKRMARRARHLRDKAVSEQAA